jgi:uncharacterized RDD family membrane protein YckC
MAVDNATPKTLFWLRVFATTIDLSVVYCLSLIVQFLIYQFTFIRLDIIFSFTFVAYYLFSYFPLNRQTVTKMFLGLKLASKNGSQISPLKIALREIFFKGFLGIIVPFFIVTSLPKVSCFIVPFSQILALLLLLSLTLLFIFKRTWWELLSNTFLTKHQVPKSKKWKAFACMTLVFGVSILIQVYPFAIQHKDVRTTSLTYPITKETSRYADFIKSHSENPVDYVFDLFKRNDIVVLSERFHPECTQYEIITRIISDKRFREEVGNLFTECGSISFQDTINTYLHTSFDSNDSLNHATAVLQRNSNAIWPIWTNTNLFDLFKAVNKLNRNLSDSEKINWYFTDLAVDWQTSSKEKFEASFRNPSRDSLMAAHIIAPYQNIISKQSRHKALVIMNTRHGYGLVKEDLGKFSQEYKGTAAFLMQYLPGKVANVMINTVSFKYASMPVPIQNGKWETAFEQAGNPSVGFDFNGSPFGDDNFDLHLWNARGIRYKDMFTGFIFHKPLTEHFSSWGFPYEYDGFEDTILKRASYVGEGQVAAMKDEIKSYKANPHNPIYRTRTDYFSMYNKINSVILPLFLIIPFLISLLFLLFKESSSAVLREKNRARKELIA